MSKTEMQLDEDRTADQKIAFDSFKKDKIIDLHPLLELSTKYHVLSRKESLSQSTLAEFLLDTNEHILLVYATFIFYRYPWNRFQIILMYTAKWQYLSAKTWLLNDKNSEQNPVNT